MERIDLSKPREEVKSEVVGLLETLAKKTNALEIEIDRFFERSGIKDFIHYDTHLLDFEVERLLTNVRNGVEHSRMSLNILRYGIQYGIGKEGD
jgi:hypothetical protein